MTLVANTPAALVATASANPGAIFAQFGISCLAWRNLDDASKRSALVQAFGLSFAQIYSELMPPDRPVAMPPSTAQTPAAARRYIGGTLDTRFQRVGFPVHAPNPWDVALAEAIAILDRHCQIVTANVVPFRGSAVTVIARPAGQAATPSPYLQVASYTRGPTLLAIGVAAVAGYAVAHFTAKKR